MSNPRVLGFIVRSGIYPALAVVMIQHGDDFVAVFATGDRQVVDITSIDELSATSKYFIEHKSAPEGEEYSATKLAFAISRDEILFLEANELREELLARAKYTEDQNLSEAFADAAEDILSIG